MTTWYWKKSQEYLPYFDIEGEMAVASACRHPEQTRITVKEKGGGVIVAKVEAFRQNGYQNLVIA